MLYLLLLFLVFGFFSTLYFYALLLFSARSTPREIKASPRHRFLVLIAAHDEAAVIENTVRRILALDYPRTLFEVHVVADHCSDRTAELARLAGATAHVRDEGERGKKSVALAWLYTRVRELPFDAIVLLDADAKVDRQFLSAMNDSLAQGRPAIQGLQIISNPRAGWYPALTSAMYRIDNLVHNQGRSTLGGSARHMGDSICLKRAIVDRYGFGSGLTEDHLLRQKLLLAGERIYFDSRAVAYNEAAPTWHDAKIQRTRWMQGTIESDGDHRWKLLKTGLRQKRLAPFEAGVEVLLPAYSTLAVFSFFLLVVTFFVPALLPLSVLLLIAVAGFPFAALALARAPREDYTALLRGPFFILWRVSLSLSLRLFPKKVVWVRTPHGKSA